MAQAIATAPQRRNRTMFLVAIFCAAIAAVLVYAALRSAGSDSNSSVTSVADTTVVVTASRDVPANAILTADMLEVRRVPVGSQLDGVFASTAGVVGLPTRFPLQAGEQITPLKVGLTKVDDEKDVALVLPQGMRGFSVKVSEVTGVGGLLLPGNFVDVIAVRDEGTGASSAETLLQDVELIAVGQEAQQAVPATGDAATGLTAQRPDDVKRQPDATSVTLAVDPEEAQQLALVQQSGAAIWLSLRPAGDHNEYSTGVSTLQPPVAEAAP